jgi:hypothetical protein
VETNTIKLIAVSSAVQTRQRATADVLHIGGDTLACRWLEWMRLFGMVTVNYFQ